MTMHLSEPFDCGGHEKQQGLRPVWEHPEFANKPFSNHLLRSGSVRVGGSEIKIDDKGMADIKGVKYAVFTGLNNQEININLPSTNAVFSDDCESAGTITMGGHAIFCCRLSAKEIKARSVRFEKGLNALTSIHAFQGDLGGRGDLYASVAKASDNIWVNGMIDSDFVMSRDGFLQAYGIRAQKALGAKGIIAFNSGIAAKRIDSLVEGMDKYIWSYEGGISSVGDIRTGQLCAADTLSINYGGLSIVGDAFCLKGDIRGPVTDYLTGKDSSQRIYSLKGCKIGDSTGSRVFLPAKEIPPDQLGPKLEDSVFALDRWNKLFSSQ